MATYLYPRATGVYGRTAPAAPTYAAPPKRTGLSAATPTDAYAGDPLLVAYRNIAMQDAASRASGARYGAVRSASNDPSLAAYAGTEGLLRGQGDASRGLMETTADFLKMREGERFQEYMLRLRARLAQEEARKAAAGALPGQLAGLAGTVAGAYFGGR